MMMTSHGPLLLLSGSGFRRAARFGDDRSGAAGHGRSGEERERQPEVLPPVRRQAPTRVVLADVRFAPQPRVHVFRGHILHAVFSKRASGQSFKTSAILRMEASSPSAIEMISPVSTFR